uniref:Uncharacterized protein n=1 Tax=Arundo donax TaxID=35708 RepID=A0A0A9ET28_ARUDO
MEFVLWANLMREIDSLDSHLSFGLELDTFQLLHSSLSYWTMPFHDGNLMMNWCLHYQPS